MSASSHPGVHGVQSPANSRLNPQRGNQQPYPQPGQRLQPPGIGLDLMVQHWPAEAEGGGSYLT